MCLQEPTSSQLYHRTTLLIRWESLPCGIQRACSPLLIAKDRRAGLGNYAGSPSIRRWHSIERSFDNSPVVPHNDGAPTETCLLHASGFFQSHGHVLKSNDATDGLWWNHGLRNAIHHGRFFDKCDADIDVYGIGTQKNLDPEALEEMKGQYAKAGKLQNAVTSGVSKSEYVLPRVLLLLLHAVS